MLHQQPVPLSYKWSFDSTIPFANEWDASAQDDTRDMNQVSDFSLLPSAEHARPSIVYSLLIVFRPSEDLHDSAATVPVCVVHRFHCRNVRSGTCGSPAECARGAAIRGQAVAGRPQGSPGVANANQLKISQRGFVHGEGGRSG